MIPRRNLTDEQRKRKERHDRISRRMQEALPKPKDGQTFGARAPERSKGRARGGR